MENYENNGLFPEEEIQEEQHVESIQPEPDAEEPVCQEPVFQMPQRPASEPYSGVGVGRKESPFADSPYVMNHQTENRTYQPDPNAYRCGSTYVPPIPPQPPVKPKKQRKKLGKGWKNALCAVLALAVVLALLVLVLAVMLALLVLALEPVFRHVQFHLINL